jgi:serine/threonine-protein kinase
LPGDIPPAVRAIVDRALAKDPAHRWPTAAAMAVVARQAAASLTTSIQQPSVNGSAVRPQSASPVSNRPASSSPASGPPKAPYSQPLRPVSGGQARGAAPVPPAQPYRHPSVPPMQQQPQPQPQPQRPESSGSRQVLIVLAVVLALLVLLCAGVISFLYNQGNKTAMAPSEVARTGVVDGSWSPASYRLRKQVDPRRSLTHASEGRQTL